MKASFRSWALIAIFRLVSVVLVQTWFVPDEVYQSSEVAHHVVYGTGHLSWEWTSALRSCIHPAIIVVIYRTLHLFGIDSRYVVANAPRVFHALLFSLGDLSFLSVCQRLIPYPSCVKHVMVTYMSSWFVFYCAPRTLSNSLETALTLIALHWYPFEGRRYKRHVWPYISLGVLTIVIRPTAALIWIVLGLNHLWQTTSHQRFGLLFFTVVPAVLPVLAFAIGMDSLAYGRLAFSMWNFLSFNVLQGGSAHFGVHPWHWYFSQGLPAVLTIQLVPIIFGYFSTPRISKLPMVVVVFYVLFHSCLPHKEHRFLLPIIPFACFYAGSFFYCRRQPTLRSIIYYAMITINIVVACYIGVRHQIGPYNAADSIIKMSIPTSRVIALMPCYSMPGHSYFHNSIRTLRQLDCSPDLLGTGQMDEADYFYASPKNWLAKNPIDDYTHLLMYNKTYGEFGNVLQLYRNGFRRCQTVFHSDFLTSSRQDHYIVVCVRDRWNL